MNAEVFWSKVHQRPDGCWWWMGNVATHGYGRLWVGGRRVRAHRMAYVLTHGVIPDGLCVLHRCDVKRCVRPDHLFLGTVGDNNHDKAVKGRATRICGSFKGTAKLTEDAVISMRADYTAGGIGKRKLAQRYGVSRTQVIRILRGELWKNTGVP